MKHKNKMNDIEEKWEIDNINNEYGIINVTESKWKIEHRHACAGLSIPTFQ